ncbi:hypothetical protein GCM10010400_38100 [Streptomyces aculeolatus]|uniref:hypothetical protein n=1 Tax=Streptomyces aculeolatus TaxID=270689 RepID=UPI001CEC9357|nr:hypothetical protein [Streptomyces aculeolatus]
MYEGFRNMAVGVEQMGLCACIEELGREVAERADEMEGVHAGYQFAPMSVFMCLLLVYGAGRGPDRGLSAQELAGGPELVGGGWLTQ